MLSSPSHRSDVPLPAPKCPPPRGISLDHATTPIVGPQTRNVAWPDRKKGLERVISSPSKGTVAYMSPEQARPNDPRTFKAQLGGSREKLSKACPIARQSTLSVTVCLGVIAK